MIYINIKILIINIIFFLQCILFTNVLNAIETDSYIWLEYGKQIKGTDGSVEQILWIKHKPGSSHSTFKNLKAIYRVDRRNKYYSVPVKYENNEPQIKIIAGKSSFFEILVFAKDADTDYFAEASFHLFGNSNKTVNRDIIKDKTKLFPMLKIVSPAYNYWPQTGQKYKFSFNSEEGVYSDVEAKVIDGNLFSRLLLDNKGEFVYMPCHDKQLDAQGIGAYKGNIIYLKKNFRGKMRKMTYTLLLHRSRFAHHNLKYGLILITGTIIFFLIYIIFKRRYRNCRGVA